MLCYQRHYRAGLHICIFENTSHGLVHRFTGASNNVGIQY